MTSPKPSLPKYCFARGTKIWIRLKDETGAWRSKPTGLSLDQVDQARRLVQASLRQIDVNRESTTAGVRTVQDYGRRWCDEREQRGVGSAAEERSRLETYVFPHVGSLELGNLRPRHVRDMVRALRALKDDEGHPLLAPRTVINIYATLHNVCEGAIVDEFIIANPVKVKRGELPKKVDADPAWRSTATYQMDEVVRLVTDPIIPVERRVRYALKAISGLRHGEAAALQWNLIDWTAEPLARINVVQSFCSRTGKIKRTKSEETRAVPVHEVLARVLVEWRDVHWPRVYGRAPRGEDLVVPTRTMRSVTVKDANEAMKRDLAVLGLRVGTAGDRDRGGHDLRSWYQTRMIEDGADSLLIRRTTHAAPKDVNSGYERFSWAAICREVAKLKFELGPSEGGEPGAAPACAHCGGTGRARLPALALVTSSLQAEKKAAGRWSYLVTPSGLEHAKTGSSLHESVESSTEDVETRQHPSTRAVTGLVTRRSSTRKSSAARIAAEVELAIGSMDLERAKDLLRRLRGLEAAASREDIDVPSAV